MGVTNEPSAPPRAADALGDDICELAALNHAAMAQLVRRVVAFDDVEGWAGDGIRSCADWLSINAGLGVGTAREMLSVGRALAELPLIAASFAAGQLSFDKVRSVCRVAAAADEEIWRELAQQASSAQLDRISRAVRRAIETDAPHRAEAHLAERGLWAHWCDDGMLRMRALLPSEEGAMVLAAIKAVTARPSPTTDISPDRPVADPALDPGAARRADALAALCETALVATSTTTPSATRMLVHVDVGVLTGAEPDGRAHVAEGPPLSATALRRLGCDAEVVAVTERDGLPIDVGRAHRIVHTSLRRALQVRDGYCRFPGCMVSAQLTHAHHLRHWIDGGRTNLDNLVSLCGFHHRRLHDGAYRIRNDAGGHIFERTDGRRISPSASTAVHSAHELYRRIPTGVTPDTPRAGERGAEFDFAHAVGVIAESCARRRARAGPDP